MGQQMAEPAPEALPRGAKSFPIRFGELETFLLVALKDVIQLACDTLIGNDGIGLIVPALAS